MDIKMGSDRDVLFVNRECVVTKGEADNVAQRLTIRLRTFLSEWYLNSEYGVPYRQILGRKIKKSAADLIIQEQILMERGVAQITKFTSYIDNKREYHCTFSVRTLQGGITPPISI